MADIVRVDAGLHAETADRTQHIAPHTEKVAVILHGFLGNTTVHHHDRNIALPDRPEKIRPQFRFHRHKNAGMDPTDDRFRHPG